MKNKLSRHEIYHLAKSYVEHSNAYCEAFEKYGFSKSTFYRLLHISVEQHIVSNNLATTISKRAIFHSRKKAGKGAASRVMSSWQKSFYIREHFEFSKKKAKEWTIRYANSNLNKSDFCMTHHLPTKLFDCTLVTAITQNFIKDDVVEKLRNKALSFHHDEKTILFFEGLEKLRNQNKCQSNTQ